MKFDAVDLDVASIGAANSPEKKTDFAAHCEGYNSAGRMMNYD